MLLNRLTQITPEQEALIPVYWEKWKNFSLSTERLNRQKAIAAARVYCIAFGLNWRDIHVCDSPYAALNYFKNSSICQSGLWYEAIIERMNRWHLILIDYAEELARLSNPQRYRNKLLSLLNWEQLTGFVDSLQRPVYTQLETQLESFEGWINIIGMDLVACRFLFDFYTSVLNWSFEWKEASAAYRLLGNTSDWILHNGNTCIVCDRPIKLSLDSENRPHAEGEAAISFADGFSIYAEHGVRVPEQYNNNQNVPE